MRGWSSSKVWNSAIIFVTLHCDSEGEESSGQAGGSEEEQREKNLKKGKAYGSKKSTIRNQHS